MGRFSVIDIGTQSVLHLIADHDGRGGVSVLQQRTAAARLGEGLAKRGAIAGEPVRRLLRILNEYREEAAAAGVRRIAAVGTRVFRAASNREKVLRAVAQHTGLDIEVLSGEQEARFGYLGATWGRSYTGTVTLLDIGGGSTEIVQGEDTRILDWRSIAAGAVTCTETRCGGDEIARFFRGSDALLQSPRLVGIGGTITTLAALDLGLEQYDAHAVEGHMLTADTILEMSRRLADMNSREREAWVSIDPGRADILPAGTMILNYLLVRSGRESITVHDRGLRFGVVLREAGLI